ncbi:MAG: hypothetical protein P8Y64_12550 [Gammaproteobacteria bacterium]|jgi:hypothetical protein
MVRRLLILALLFAAPLAAARDWPHLDVPKGVHLVWVSGVVQANGYSQRIADLRSDVPLKVVLDFYRTHWAGTQSLNGHKVPGFLLKSVPPWEIISRLQDGYLIAIQLRPDGAGGTQGKVSISDLSRRPATSLPPFPMPDGSHVVNDMPSYDGGRKARTLMLVNYDSISSNADFYSDYFRQRGWRQVISKGDDNGRAHVLIMEQAGRSVNFFMQTSGGMTMVVVNLTGGVDLP